MNSPTQAEAEDKMLAIARQYGALAALSRGIRDGAEACAQRTRRGNTRNRWSRRLLPSEAPMIEWVVTLRTGRRIELEAERYDYIPAGGDALHTFVQADGSETGYSGNVVCVQRRDGHHLEQVWPAS